MNNDNWQEELEAKEEGKRQQAAWMGMAHGYGFHTDSKLLPASFSQANGGYAWMGDYEFRATWDWGENSTWGPNPPLTFTITPKRTDQLVTAKALLENNPVDPGFPSITLDVQGVDKAEIFPLVQKALAELDSKVQQYLLLAQEVADGTE